MQITKDNSEWAEPGLWFWQDLPKKKKGTKNEGIQGLEGLTYTPLDKEAPLQPIWQLHYLKNIRRAAAVKRPTLGALWAIMLDGSHDFAAHSGSCTLLFVDRESLLHKNCIISNQSWHESRSTLADREAPFGKVTQSD